MSKHPRITVTLPPELKEMVDSRVRSGRYCDSGEVVREALRVWDAGGDSGEDPRLEALIESGLESPCKPVTQQTFRRIRTEGVRLARARTTVKTRRTA